MAKSIKYKLSGVITNLAGRPHPNMSVIAFMKKNDREDIELGSVRTNQEGKYEFSFSGNITEGTRTTIVKPNVFIRVVSGNKLLGESPVLIGSSTKLEINMEIDHRSESRQKRIIQGRVFTTGRLVAPGVALKLMRNEFGGEEVVGRTQTDDLGKYKFEFDNNDIDFAFRIVATGPHDKDIPLMSSKYNADAEEEMNLVVPENLVDADSEFKRMMDSIRPLLKGRKLGDAKEDEHSQDLTFLFEATGWDSRLIGLAALADQRADETGIGAEALYGLFRVGLPSGIDQLGRVSEEGISKGLEKANQENIIAVNITEVLKLFTVFSLKTIKEGGTAGGLATVDDFIDKMGLQDAEKKKVSDLFFKQDWEGGEVWEKAKEAGISNDTINKMQVQGKLSFLTLNNAILTEKLQKEISKPEHLSSLAETGYYNAEKWKKLITGMTSNDITLEDMIPENFVGNTDEDRLETYAGDMARKIRAAYPTQSLAGMIKNSDIRLGESHAELKEPVFALLQNASAIDTKSGPFVPGSVSLPAFIKEHKQALMKGIPSNQQSKALESLKTLAKLYQLSPTDDAMQVLFDNGFTSALEVAAIPRKDWEMVYAPKFRSEHEAEVVYSKAEETRTMMYNFYTATDDLNQVGPKVTNSTPQEMQAVKNDIIKTFPTLETLFGSMDFCECTHCRSVLSPAAYLVDILKFLEPDTKGWERSKELWKQKNGAVYPHPRPYNVLTARRADLPLIPLNCENTNTVMPYIDIVNEIMECYVAGQSLTTVAFDTGENNSQDLIAEPQNINQQAYKILDGEVFPMNQPFDYSVQLVRKLSEHFGSSFHDLLFAFRKNNDLLPGTGATYALNDVFIESLGFSPREYKLFTEPDFTNWFKLYGYDDGLIPLTPASAADVGRVDILSAKTLSRKLGVSYKELAELVKTSFINPSLNELVILRSLQIDAADVFRWKAAPGFTAFTNAEKTAFEASLTAASTPGFNAQAWLNQFWTDNQFSRIILLYETAATDNFDDVKLQFANTNPLTSLEWTKLNLFVRLWRKLGWTMEEVDHALNTFLPTDAGLNATNFGTQMKTALIYLAHLKTLHQKYPLGKNSLQKWTSLWGRIDKGPKSLYSLDFLTGVRKKEDPVYTHPLGKYLSYLDTGVFVPFTYDPALPENKDTGNVGLIDHLPSLQGALGLTASEISAVLSLHNIDINLAPLTIANVSLLNGYRVLREATKLSVTDLIILQQLSGLQPLKKLKGTPITLLADDHPYSQLIEFLEVAADVAAYGLSIADLDFLARDHFDPVGKYAPDDTAVISFVKKLGQEMKTIQLDQAFLPDDANYTDEFIQERLVLALSSAVAEQFMKMWNNSVVTQASRSVTTTEKLRAKVFPGNANIVFSYDAVRRIQKLSYTGTLDDSMLARLTTQITAMGALQPSHADYLTAAQATHATKMLEDVNQQLKDFYNEHVFKTIFSSNVSQSYSSFFPVTNSTDTEEAQAVTRSVKRATIGKKALEFLRVRLTEEAIDASVIDEFDMDPALAKYLLNDTGVLAVNGETIHRTYSHAAETGLQISYIDEATETVIDTSESPTGSVAQSQLPPSTTLVVIEGLLMSKLSEAYRFTVNASQAGALVKLFIGGESTPLIQKTFTSTDLEGTGLIDLAAGVDKALRIEIRNLTAGTVDFSVQTETIPLSDLQALSIIPIHRINAIRNAHRSLKKAMQVITHFNLKENEIRYLVNNPSHFYQLSLKELPVKELSLTSNTESAIIRKLFHQFRRLSHYLQLRTDITAGNTNLADLMSSIRDNSNTTRQIVVASLALFTRRDPVLIDQLTTAFGYQPDSFVKEDALKKTWSALQLMQSFGISVESVSTATDVISKTDSFELRMGYAIAFKQALKSHFIRENWNRVAQSVYDKMRPLQRDSLAAWVMFKKKFLNMGQLFEFFLIDPGMEPVVQTSRIRLAISSVQTFVQRCLLNLEKEVSPSMIARGQWEWMKRYRVWEANRKIFLYPENWLVPEFRDDKTHLYKELEGAVMQGDINKELVERAFLQYLRGLEKISRLNMVAMYCEEDPVQLSNNTIHLIGKSYSANSYYYRSYRNNMWTPWVPIPDQIEGEHLALIKWQDRLHIFWLTFVPKSESTYDTEAKIEDAAVKTTSELMTNSVEIQLNWCQYFEGEWQGREMGGIENVMRANVSQNFNSNDVYMYASIEYHKGEETAVLVHVNSTDISQAFRLVSRLAHPVADADYYNEASKPPFEFESRGKTKYKGKGDLQITFNDKITKITTKVGGKRKKPKVIKHETTATLLKNTKGTSFLFCNDVIEVSGDKEIDSLISPFFFEDNERSVTMYVEPQVIEKTVTTWEEWIIREKKKNKRYDDDKYWKEIPVSSFVPYDKYVEFEKVIKPGLNPHLNEADKILNKKRDWVLDARTVINYGDNLIGARGGVILEEPFVKAGNDVKTPDKQRVVNVRSSRGAQAGRNLVVKERSSSMQGNRFGLENKMGGNVKSIRIVGEGGAMPGSFENGDMRPEFSTNGYQ